MTPGVRVIRFARVDAKSRPDSNGPVLVSRVLLDEQPDSVGGVVLHGNTWSYVLPDGSASGLSSVASRQDLERQILLYHLGPLPVDVESAPPNLKLAM